MVRCAAYDLVHARGTELVVWLALDLVKHTMTEHSMTQHSMTQHSMTQHSMTQHSMTQHGRVAVDNHYKCVVTWG